MCGTLSPPSGTCQWDPLAATQKTCRLLYTQVTDTTAQDVEFTIELDQLSEWIRDVKKIFLRDLFEDGTKP
jgi:hypothetical protein